MNKSILLFLGLVCNIMVAQDIPEAISPNGDEYNQYFDLSTLDVNKLEIYNRYGNLFIVEITIKRNGMDKILEMVHYQQELISTSLQQVTKNKKPDQFT